MRLNRGTLALIIVSVLVIIGVILVNNPTVTEPSANISGRLFNLFSNRVAQFTVVDSTLQAETTYTRQDNDLWGIDSTAPELGLPNDVLIVGGLDLILGLGYVDFFEAEDLTGFGLDSPRYQFNLMTVDDEQLALSVGNLAPDETVYYGQLNNDNRIYLLTLPQVIDRLAGFASEPPYQAEAVTPEAIDGLLFSDVFGYEVESLTIRDLEAETFITYSQTDDGEWELSGTFVNEDEVDVLRVAQDVSAFLLLQAVDTVDVAVNEADLDRPQVQFDLTTFSNQQIQLEVGYLSSDMGYYAQVTGQDAIIIISRNAINELREFIRNPPIIE